jgi:hypothetical protein
MRDIHRCEKRLLQAEERLMNSQLLLEASKEKIRQFVEFKAAEVYFGVFIVSIRLASFL